MQQEFMDCQPSRLGSILLSAGFVQVVEILESPGISENHFPGLESPGILMQVLRSAGNLNWATFYVIDLEDKCPEVFNLIKHGYLSMQTPRFP